MGRTGGVLVLVAAAVALTLGAVAPASANVFALDDGQDPRVALPRTGEDRVYAPIGVITTDAAVPASEDGKRQIRTRGTAFLVSPCYVLSNYHAVFGLAFDGPDEGRDYSTTFSVGADPDYTFRWQVHATPVRWGAFNRKKEHDWALLKLDGCVGGQPDIGWLETGAETPADLKGSTVAFAGFPSDKALTSLWVQTDCKVEGPQPGTVKILHACSVRTGASGSPLIATHGGAPRAVAIQCGELNATRDPLRRYDPKYANTAVTLAEVLADPEVKAALDADRAAFPGPNPALNTPAPAAPTAPAPTVVTAAADAPSAKESATGAGVAHPSGLP